MTTSSTTNTNIPKKVHPLVPIILGILFVAVACFLIFVLKRGETTLEKTVIGILLSLGCGLIATLLVGEFTFKNIISVSGSIGIVCFILFSFLKNTESKKIVDEKSEIFFNAFTTYSAFEIFIRVIDRDNKEVIRAEKGNVAQYLSNIECTPIKLDNVDAYRITMELLIKDSNLISTANILQVAIDDKTFKRTLDKNGFPSYNDDIWTYNSDKLFSGFSIYEKKVEKNNKLDLKIKK